MTLEKQVLIDKIVRKSANLMSENTIGGCDRRKFCISLEKYLQKHLPQEDTHQKTTVPNVLLYETGYKQGREDMKKEIRKIIANKWKQGKEIRLDDIKNLLFPTDTN